MKQPKLNQYEKKCFRKFAFTALIAGFVMVSCGKDDDGNDLNVRDNELAGSISGHLELDPELEYYLNGPLIVEEGGVLDIPAGTVIKDIYIYDGADDGIEFFGGSVNVTNLLVVNSDDDMFDFTQGYSGTLKNAYGIWESGFSSSESDPRGIEADGNLDGNFPTHVNQSDFRIENITFDLRLDHASGDLIDLTDGKGYGDLGSQISLTNMLDNAIDGSEIKPADAEAIVVESGNIGCDSKLFSWTGYEF